MGRKSPSSEQIRIYFTLQKKEVFGRREDMLQNLLCLWKKKTHVVFFVFNLEQLSFFPYECPVDIDQGIHKGKMKVALHEK